ncbi:MAG: AAA family ATPase [Chthoniobacteraceae bacterium]
MALPDSLRQQLKQTAAPTLLQSIKTVSDRQGEEMDLADIVACCLGHPSIQEGVSTERTVRFTENLRATPATKKIHGEAAIDLVIKAGRAFQARVETTRPMSPKDLVAGVLIRSGGDSEGEKRIYDALIHAGIDLGALLANPQRASSIYQPLGYGVDCCAAMAGVAECPLFGLQDLLINLAIRLRGGSACLIGEPGVGKSAVVNGLAWHIAHGSPFILGDMRKWRIVSISRSDLLAGTSERGGLETRIGALITHLAESPEVILFLDEVHSLLDAQDKNGAHIINALKPAMADLRAPLRLIAATTDREFERHIMPDEALNSRLAPTFVIPEASPEATVAILNSLLPRLLPRVAKAAGVAPDLALLRSMVELSARYQRLDCQPRKSIRLLNWILQRKDYQLEQDPTNASPEITHSFVLESARELWKINITREDPAFWSRLHGALLAEAPAQAACCRSIAAFFLRATRRQLAPRPIGTPLSRILILHDGGHSALSLDAMLAVLRRSMFDDERAGEREDLREFSHAVSRTRFVGAPPGYTGFGETRTVLAKVRSRPQGGVLILANPEAAHPELEPDLLALLEGTARDSAGRPVEASQWVMVLTMRTPAADTEPLSLTLRAAMDLVCLLAPEEETSASPSFEDLVLKWRTRGIPLPADIQQFSAEFGAFTRGRNVSPDAALDEYFQAIAEREIASPIQP